MTLGGAPNPSQWSDVSEVVADLANDLVRRLKWDAALMKCPHQEALISDRAVDSDSGFVQADDSFGVAYPMSVVFPSDEGHALSATWTTCLASFAKRMLGRQRRPCL